MTNIVGGFATLGFNEPPFNGRSGILRVAATPTEWTPAVAVIAGDADSSVDRIWLKPEPTLYLPRECTES